MEGLKIYSKADLLALVSRREGETRLGEQVQHVSSAGQLQTSTAKFVLLGIPEDIGVRANYGIAGASTAWQPALKALLNIQSTPSFKGDELLVLGHFEFSEPADNSISGLQQKVAEIDDLVYPVVQKIVEAGKIPIVIGGGHNNAFPIMKGISKALNRPVDVLNIDAHADLRATAGRHSGNGFSYALKQGFLKHYSVFGLHQNYNNGSILQEIAKNPDIQALFFDDMLKSSQPVTMFWDSLLKQSGAAPGLEIDLDAIADVLSSAVSPSGFSLNEVRSLVLRADKKFAYLHLCEGAVALTDGRQSTSTPKTIAYLISDFIRSQP
ncbi:formimidoylglutamase [Pedobacter heparinus]|uniref:Arginase/agmatinase/formiminoglutamase n=1 Tax=Pedobacter heparinus (strain ATCC 13125 / DSM 2366 / CIP 104194 / JCM 7457 / NBRC 12017 / NCIMB 9290 / NRRL B-14731 / HIM 762-3) TaxID=485917 RepID=C6XXF8_PEDHD|nr:formimidoylglutamase [Pedobacter heparinus]ACU06464.1 Arginase/agmatinase/formiminoglutamase [Pedobacter heparinus DSM 2366]